MEYILLPHLPEANHVVVAAKGENAWVSHKKKETATTTCTRDEQ